MAKEILKEEKLDDEQLEKVAGGTMSETNQDIDDFEALGIKIRSSDAMATYSGLEATFHEYGVHCEVYLDNDIGNIYYIFGKSDGKPVSREEAWKYIKSQFGK